MKVPRLFLISGRRTCQPADTKVDPASAIRQEWMPAFRSANT